MKIIPRLDGFEIAPENYLEEQVTKLWAKNDIAIVPGTTECHADGYFHLKFKINGSEKVERPGL